MERRNLMAYIAGLIDGDGSLSLCKRHDAKCQYPYYYPLVQFSKSSELLTSLLHKEFSGSIGKGTLKSGLMFYRWKLEKSRLCQPFLEAIEPYLHNKKKQASTLISYIEENPFCRGQRITYDQVINREKAYIEMKKLNSFRDRASTFREINSSVDKDLVWAYLSGLLDTDGSFSIKKEKKGSYSPVILLSMLNSSALNFIRKWCKYGSYFLVKDLNIKQKFYYRLGFYSKKDCIAVLHKVLPYLRHKKKNAEILLRFCEGFVSQPGRYLKTDEQTLFREDCYKELVKINKYGVSKSSLMDLKLLPGNAGDNKAQAAKACSVNVASGKTLKEDAVL